LTWQNCRKAVTQSLRPGADAPGSGVAGGDLPSFKTAGGWRRLLSRHCRRWVFSRGAKT
jgi:hypothetical protein